MRKNFIRFIRPCPPVRDWTCSNGHVNYDSAGRCSYCGESKP